MALTRGKSGFGRSSRRGGGGSYTPSPRGGYRYTPGRGTVGRGAVLSGARARRGGYTTVYGTLVGTPMGEATYWATRGMSSSMRGATIGAVVKLHRALGTLTSHECSLIRPHLSGFEPEFQRKFHQADMKVKLKTTKVKMQPRDFKRVQPTTLPSVPSVQGVTMGLTMGATHTALKAMQWWAPKTAIVQAGERVGIEAAKLKRWVSGEQPAPATAMEAMYPSYVVGVEEHEKKATAFETKWAPYTKGEYFTGTEAEHREYLGKHVEVRREGARLERQYETFGQLEKQVEREEKEKGWGIPAAYKREQEYTAKWTAARTPRVLATGEYVAKTQKGKITIPERVAYTMFERPLALSAEHKYAREEVRGMYEGMREKPFEIMATTAVFAALPPVLKGAKHVSKAARFAPAAKWVQPTSLVLKKGKRIKYPALAKVKAPVKVGMEKGILPSSARFLPKVAGYGMGATYAGAMGYEMYVTPPSERAYKLGRMTATEIAPMAVGTYVGVKAPSMISGAARAARIVLLRKKLKMKDLTPEQIASAKQQILYIEKGVTPAEFKQSAYDLQYEYGMPTLDVKAPTYAKIRMKTGKLGGIYTRNMPSGFSEEVLGWGYEYALARGKARKLYPVGEEYEPGVKVWKMMNIDWGKQTVIQRGHFEHPGGYVSPQGQPFFLRMSRQKTKWELFGSEFPTSEMGARPTAMRITLEDIARLPKKVRATRDPYSMTAYALGKGEVGKAYVSIPIELGTKLESELVIAPTTGMKWTPSPTGKEYYTTWKQRVIPIEHYEWFETGMKRPEIGLESGKYFVKRPRATAIIETEKGIVLHPGERGEGLILPGGGIETAAEVAAKKGVKVAGERAAEAAMREVHEEIGVKVSGISKRLFGYESTEIPVYSRGRQKWYSKTYHDVFAVDIIGKPKPVSREVSKVVYWKPGSEAKLSKDTEAILKEYMTAKKKRVIPKEPVTKERMKQVLSRAEQRKERIKKGEPKTFEESLKYKEYGAPTQKRAALISPLGLGVEHGIKKITRSLVPYTTLKYEKGISEVAYPKYPRKYIKEAYPKRVPYSKRKPYKKPEPTKYPKHKRTKYPKPKPIKYPKPVPTKYPKPVPHGYPKPAPKPVPYPKPTPRKGPPLPPPKIKREPPPPIIEFGLELPKAKPRKQLRAKKQPYAWRVKNPIPELQEMVTQKRQRGGPKLL